MLTNEPTIGTSKVIVITGLNPQLLVAVRENDVVESPR